MLIRFVIRPLALWLATLVSLTPLTAGATHIDITGFATDTWTKELGVRLDLAGEPAGTFGIHTPYVFRTSSGLLRMYYDAFGSGKMRSATSTDGLAWTKEAGDRLTGVAHPHVLDIGGGSLRMYFETGTAVGSATSTDGLAWTVEGGDRIASGADPIVFEILGGYRMYYRIGSSILSATSTDGLAFSPEAGVRISGAVEFGGIRQPDGSVILYYGDASPGYTMILSARSGDGISFTLDPGTRLLPGGPPGLADGGHLLTTSLVEFPGNVLRMYYQASPAGAGINDGSQVFSAVAALVPEPSSLLLIASGLTGIFALRVTRRSKTTD
jgi:hypothetical protein